LDRGARRHSGGVNANGAERGNPILRSWFTSTLMGGAVLLLLLRGCLRGGFPATEKHSIFGRMAGVRSAFDASADGMTASFHRLRVREDFGFHIFNRTTELSLHR